MRARVASSLESPLPTVAFFGMVSQLIPLFQLAKETPPLGTITFPPLLMGVGFQDPRFALRP